jgi:hypothetical protein
MKRIALKIIGGQDWGEALIAAILHIILCAQLSQKIHWRN